MKIIAYSSRPHYAAHLRPIVDNLPESVCDGTIYSPFTGSAWGPELPPALWKWVRGAPREVLWLVASYVDAQKVNGPFVYVEHGAGQSYGGDEGAALNASYAGGEGRSWADCVLIIAPGNIAGARHLMRRNCPVALVGCPYLDPWHRGDRGGRVPGSTPTRIRNVAFTFHWDGSEVCPEARSALSHYETGLESAVARLIGFGWEVWGHGHPRDQTALEAVWHGLEVPWVSREAIFDAADVLVADNTSLLWEFISLGKPVVFLDAPWYRHYVEHGLRFWRWAAAGVGASSAEEIPAAVELAYADDRRVAQLRSMATREVYAYTDGSSTERAVQAIMEVVSAQPIRSAAGEV